MVVVVGGAVMIRGCDSEVVVLCLRVQECLPQGVHVKAVLEATVAIDTGTEQCPAGVPPHKPCAGCVL